LPLAAEDKSPMYFMAGYSPCLRTARAGV
jgi:hypothetical protein